MSYQRILLKLSGEALIGTQATAISPQQLAFYAQEIQKVHSLNVAVSVVIGGGNIYRGADQASKMGIPRVQGDYMGMLATVINGLALQSALDKVSVPSRVMSSWPMGPVCEPYSQSRALEHLEKRKVIIFVGGLGSPYFSTDSAASVRALEINAQVLLKGTQVDGIYTADPKHDPSAQRLTRVTFQEAYQKQLRVMDLTAFALCAENNLPIIVFDVHQPGHLCGVVQGEKLGTIVL